MKALLILHNYQFLIKKDYVSSLMYKYKNTIKYFYIYICVISIKINHWLHITMKIMIIPTFNKLLKHFFLYNLKKFL